MSAPMSTAVFHRSYQTRQSYPYHDCGPYGPPDKARMRGLLAAPGILTKMYNMGIQPTPPNIALLDESYHGAIGHPLGTPPPPRLSFPEIRNGQPISRRMILSNSMSALDDNSMRQMEEVDSMSVRSMPPMRKRLYFSPEFLEPDLMADPPPVATEFLVEVRRMIGIAKNRIRSKRHIPSLLVIPEDTNSLESAGEGQDNHAYEASPTQQRSSNRSSPDQNNNSSSNETSGDSGVSVTKPCTDDAIDATMDSLEGHMFTTTAQINWRSEEDELVHAKVTNWLKGVAHGGPPRPKDVAISEEDPYALHSPSSVPPSVPPEAALPKGATSPAGLPVSYSLLRRYGLHTLNSTYSDADDPFVIKEPSSFPRKHLPNGRVPVHFAFSAVRDV